MKTLNRRLFLLLIFVLILIPIAVSSARGIICPFIHGTVSLSILSLESGSMDVTSPGFREIPAVGFLIIELSQTTGIEPDVVEYLPIAGLCFILVAFILGRRFTGISITAVLIASVLVYKWLPPTLYTVWTHSFGFALYLLFVSMYFKLENGKRWQIIILLFLLFLGIHFYSYTVELWTIAFVAFVGLMSFLGRGQRQWPTLLLFLSFIVIFLAFTEIIYRSYIPKLEYASDSITVGFESMVSSLFRSQPPVPYSWVPPRLLLSLLILNLLYYVLLFLPLLLIAIAKFIQHAKARHARSAPYRPSFKSMILVAFFLVWFVDFVSYALLGAFSIGALRYITLAIPFLAIWSLRTLLSQTRLEPLRTHSNSIVFTYAFVVFVVSALAFAVAADQDYYVTSPSRYGEVHPGANWFFSHTTNADHIFSDLHTQGQYMISATDTGRFFRGRNYYNVSSFGHLVDPDLALSKNAFFENQYVVVNLALADQKTIGDTWLDFEQLRPHLPTIARNINLCKTYDDGNTWILRGV